MYIVLRNDYGMEVGLFWGSFVPPPRSAVWQMLRVWHGERCLQGGEISEKDGGKRWAVTVSHFAKFPLFSCERKNERIFATLSNFKGSVSV